MTTTEALAFIEHHGVVLQSARGRVPSLAEAIAGERIRGSWWGHPKSHEIFAVTQVVSDHPDVLVCKLVDGKVTFVHKRLWPALVKLASRFEIAELAKVWEEHTSSGKHLARKQPFPQWVPPDTRRAARTLSVVEAEKLLSVLW